MKRKEKEHLKEDPFVHFIEKVIVFFRSHKKKIYIGSGIFLALAVAVASVLIIRSSLYARDNRIFASALKIKNDATLTLNEKVERLKRLGRGKGLAAATSIYIAQSYYENQEWQRALEALKGFKRSKYGYINDNKKLLEMEILRALGKKQEAEAILTAMLADSQTEIGKDFLLLKLAKIKLADGQADAAKSKLQQLLADFPESGLGSEAQNLLSSIEGS